MKRLISILLATTILLGIIACSNQTEETAPPATEDTSTVPEVEATKEEETSKEKRIVNVFTKKREWDWEAIEKGYEAFNPQVDLVVEATDANTYYDILKGYLASQDLPDVIQTVPGPTLDLWMEYLIPLNDLKVLNQMQDDVLNEYLVDGNYYGVPIFVELHGVIYNMGFLEQVGYTKPPETLNDFIKMNEKLIEAGLPTGISPWSSAAAILGHMTAPVFSIHEKPLEYLSDIKNETIDLTKDSNWHALFDYLDATLKYGNEEALITDNTTERNALYAEEYAWYAHDGSWLTPQIKDLNPDLENRIALGVYPFTNDASINKIGRSTQSLSIMNTDHAEDAKDFVDWLLGSKEGSDILAKVCNVVLLRTDYEMTSEDIGALGTQGLEYVNEGRSYGNFRNFPDGSASDLMSAIQKYLSKVSTREETLQEIQNVFARFK